ncbi:MAG: aminotransferase DegT [Coxiella sp. RIFCSPHIGHO2_12_FULL_42_15]|nr:MAG: aminotransferase DegT [Coxiella sp. RIFCSPHIGHO2_12_FULL_42_15]
MKFVDLQVQYQKIGSEINAAISEVLNHGQYILGPEVGQVEEALADYVGVKHCITVSSGTTALHVALMALEIQPGDEVITTPFSFFGTAEVIMLLGAVPVFVDIDPATYNLAVDQLALAITPRTKAIMPVSLYGQCADWDAINTIANGHGIPVIEDAAQSFGALYKGRRSGGLTTIGCTSFFPSKPLGCYGDGGACFTNDDQLATVMRMVMNHGQGQRYQHVRLGLNGRFDTVQAAILLTKLKTFDEEIALRQKVAAWYAQHLEGAFQKPYIEPHNLSVYAQYTVEVAERLSVIAALKAEEIPTAVHYPKPLHLQPAMGPAYHQQRFPVAERAAKHVLSLPFHPFLKEEDVQHICKTLQRCVVADLVML